MLINNVGLLVIKWTDNIVHVCVRAHVRLPVLGHRASSLLLDRKQPSRPSKDKFPSLGLTSCFFARCHIHFPLFQGRYRKCILPKGTWCQLVARSKNTEAGKYTSASGIEALLFPPNTDIHWAGLCGYSTTIQKCLLLPSLKELIFILGSWGRKAHFQQKTNKAEGMIRIS